MRQLAYTMFIINNHASLLLWWKENVVKYQKVSKHYVRDCLQSNLLLFMFLSTAPNVKKQSYFGWNLLCFSKKWPVPNLKVSRYRIWNSLKRLVKQLSSKTKFIIFSQLSCSNFKLKLFEKPRSYQNCSKNQLWGGLGQIRSKNETFSKILFCFLSFY